ncbi:DUF4404 family protein [Marinimicrobium alkaliphilum]|uniref:DUF4404 family protein n=1 Tax=Marinimicrobium alkaliphilum TaxID=2202654 RepID=UPI000DBAC0BB|nr:DUF4404 family protein [Marinimicrobium alkaliphilum]
MPQQRIKTLIGELHDMYGDDQPSEAQRRLLDDVERHIHPAGAKAPPDPAMLETMELLIEDMEEEHPRTSAVLREIMITLKNIGV